MAKKKGGLGRGLGALMGDGVEADLESQDGVQEAAAKKQAPKEDAAPQIELEAVSQTKTPPSDRKPQAVKDDAARASREAPKKASARLSETVAAQRRMGQPEETVDADVAGGRGKDEHPYIEENDHVVIKGVVEREKNEIDINMIKPNPDQPRTSFKKEELEELAESIKNNGLLQPILVRKVNTMYQIIAGERRWQACKMAGLSTVPVNILKADDDKVIELAMIENIQRADLNPIEEAYGYRRLMDRKGLTQSQLAQVLSKGRSTIANSLRLLELPEDAQQLLFEEKITAGHARAILSIPSTKGRQSLTEKLIKETISVREAENIARLLAGANKSSKAQRPTLPQEYRTVAKGLSEALDTKVRVKTVKGKNKIEIEFTDEDQLEKLFRKIVPEE